jgi:hypothetical protein
MSRPEISATQSLGRQNLEFACVVCKRYIEVIKLYTIQVIFTD